MAVKLDRWEGADERSRDEAFAELYESSYPSLVKYCRGLLGEGAGADPEEVAQEAFLRAWMTWDRYAASRPFWALVATIARNLCMDHHRHERVVNMVLEQRAGELSSAPSGTPEERLEQDEEYVWARRALAELCPNHQRILSLREIEGWSADDIAAADGTSPEAATAALYRARQRLRDAYNRVAAGALAGVALFPLRGMRRRLGLWAHYGGQAAASSPGLVSHASDAVAAVVAIAVVSGAPVVNPLPRATAPDRPAPVVAQARQTGPGLGVITALTPAQAAADDGPSAAAIAARGSGVAPGANLVVAGAPEDVTVSEFTTPPAGSTSPELYATGSSPQGCVSAPCPVLFHSTDGGTTWERLKASGFEGGTVLLAPNFPTDRRIFASGPGGLQVSADNGATFSTLVPLSGPTAISPAFPTDHRILIGAVPGWQYRDDTTTTTPLDFQARPRGHTLSFAFSPTYAKDGKLFVGSSAPDPNNPTQQLAMVTTCVQDKCGASALLAGAQGLPTVQPSPTFATTGIVFAWAGDTLYRSADGGQSFKPLTLPVAAGVQGVAEDAGGADYVALLNTDPEGVTTGGVYVTRDGGKTWTQLGKDTALAKGVSSIVFDAHGRLLAAPAASGLVCSADAGKTWAKRCPAIPAPKNPATP
ncbi:MAG: sigma-70 family RNA polymerase sigma factor [Acidimicrobiia bacterium]|nr:sigma-70 family RNA polymerase sigma factor [Acidimicrobiia bacterium]